MGNALAGFFLFMFGSDFFSEFISYSSQSVLLLACVLEFRCIDYYFY